MDASISEQEIVFAMFLKDGTIKNHPRSPNADGVIIP